MTHTATSTRGVGTAPKLGARSGPSHAKGLVMRQFTVVCILGALCVFMGMNSDGCAQLGSGQASASSSPPIIIPVGASQNTFDRTFQVDLRRHPGTQHITWDFGDGGVAAYLPTANGRQVTHRFSRSGTFTVKVHLFNAPDYVNNLPSQLIGTGELPVTVVGPNQAPIAEIVIQDLTASGGSPISGGKRFRATGSRDPDGVIESFKWDFGDGTGGEGSIVEHTYTTSGVFVVLLTVTDDRGAIGTATRTILINLLPTAEFTFQIIGNDQLSVRFDASASSDPDGSITQFRWNFGDNSPQAFGSIVTHQFAVPGTYNVQLTVTDNLGQSRTTTQQVQLTGIEPFLREVTPVNGEVGTPSLELTLEGENFEVGATVQLRRGAKVIDALSVLVINAQTVRATFNLTGADPGDYDVLVDNPLGGVTTLTNGFRVVTRNLVRLTTNLGEILFQLVDDAPITTSNFLQYVEDRFYDGTIFHRVVPNFVVQGGGFLPGNIPQSGARPPIQNEFSPLRSNVRATVAMAKLGGDPDSATSQFFVNLADNSANLDNQNGGFTVFANVIEGMDVVDAIAAVPLQNDQPVNDVIIISARRE